MWKSEFKAEVQTLVVFLSFPAPRNVFKETRSSLLLTSES